MKKVALLFSIVSLTLSAQTNKSKTCDVTTYFAGHSGTFILKKNEASNITSISVKNTCDSTRSYQILSYDFTCHINGIVIALSGLSNQFTSEMRMALHKVSVGDKIYIDNVKTKLPNGAVKIVPGVFIKIR